MSARCQPPGKHFIDLVMVDTEDEEQSMIDRERIDALHRQLSLPSSDAIEWKSAYARDIDSEVHEPPPIMSASENCVQLAVLGDKIKVLELEKTKLTETIKILKSTLNLPIKN